MMKPRLLLCALVMTAGLLFAGGRTLWQDGGIQLCGPTATGAPLATSDGAGGAIVAWQDSRRWPVAIYAQRVDASGVTQWAEDGVLLCDSTVAGPAGVIDDGEHGAIAVWSGEMAGSSLALQHVDAEGNVLWGSRGLMLRPHTGPAFGYLPAIVRDGHGGAIAVWSTFGLDLVLDTLIACRVDSSGTKLWETVVRIDTLGDTRLMCAQMTWAASSSPGPKTSWGPCAYSVSIATALSNGTRPACSSVRCPR